MTISRGSRAVPLIVWTVAAVIVGGWVGPPVPVTVDAEGARPVSTVLPVSPAIVLAPTPTPAPAPRPTPAAHVPSLLPACDLADEPAQPGPGDDWSLAIVDTALRLPDGYVPPDLVPTSRAGITGSGKVREIVIDDLRAMTRAAQREDVPLQVRSAYRSESRQRRVFKEWVGQVGKRKALQVSARPGHSEHQLGTTIDFARGAVAPWTESFEDTPTGRWLAKHAAEFGFVMSYPSGRSEVTCYSAEPWHFRWIGRERAADVTASGLTLREWLWNEVE